MNRVASEKPAQNGHDVKRDPQRAQGFSPDAGSRIRALCTLALATWFGCGYFPWGPGTAGSLAAIVIALGLHFFAGWGRLGYLILVVILLVPSVWAATGAARLAKLKDPGIVVVDEVLGQWVTLLGAVALNARAFVFAFFLFRLFDIWKPWPIRKLEELPEGTGIMADDLAAGLIGALILYIGGRFRLY